MGTLFDTTETAKLSWSGPFCLGDGKSYKLNSDGQQTDFFLIYDMPHRRLYADRPYTVWNSGKSKREKPQQIKSFKSLAEAKAYAIKAHSAAR